MSTNFSQTYSCVSCGEDPYHTVPLRAVCVECPGIDLCVECLAGRVELGQHRATHKYRLVDNGGLHLLGSNWTCKELVQLLDGIEQFGHGNWADVSRYVASPNKGPAECREAVNNFFVSSAIGLATWREDQRGDAKDHTSPPQQSAGTATGTAGLAEVIMLGCMPVREDYEVEHCNDAESLVAGIEAAGKGEGETEEVETLCKLAQVDMYIEKLRERDRRKTVVKELGLVEAFFKENTLNSTTGKLSAPKPKKRDPRTEVFDRLKVFNGVQGIEEHKKLIASVTKEKELKTRIKELIRYRKNGIHQLSEAEQYEAQRVRRNKLVNHSRPARSRAARYGR